MPNPIVEQINNGVTTMPQMNPNEAYIKELRQIVSTMRNAQNPQAYLQNMVLRNPNLNKAMDLIKNMGSPEQALSALARQRGLDPNQIMEALKTL